MSDFYIVNEKRFPMPVTDIASKTNNKTDLLPYYRWEHRVTLGQAGKRYMIFLDNLKSTIYAEECTTGNLKQIDDDSLFAELFAFARTHRFLAIMAPMYKNAAQRFV